MNLRPEVAAYRAGYADVAHKLGRIVEAESCLKQLCALHQQQQLEGPGAEGSAGSDVLLVEDISQERSFPPPRALH